jgi:hypothetical protein
MATSYFDSSFGKEIASLVQSEPLDHAVSACLDAIVTPLRTVCGTAELLAYTLRDHPGCCVIAEQMVQYTQQLWQDWVWQDLFAFRSLLATCLPLHTAGGYPDYFTEQTTELSRALRTWQAPIETILPGIIEQMRLLGQHIQQALRQLTTLCSIQTDSDVVVLLQQTQAPMDNIKAIVEYLLEGVLVERIRQVCQA